MHNNDIRVSQADCWYHLRNVCFGEVIENLGTSLGDILAYDLKKSTGHCV